MQRNLTAGQKQGLMNESFSNTNTKNEGLLAQSMAGADDKSLNFGAASTIARNIAGLPQPGDKSTQAKNMISRGAGLQSTRSDFGTAGALGIGDIMSQADYSSNISLPDKPTQGKNESPESYMKNLTAWQANTARTIFNENEKSIQSNLWRSFANDSRINQPISFDGNLFMSDSDVTTYMNSDEFKGFEAIDLSVQENIKDLESIRDKSIDQRLAKISGTKAVRDIQEKNIRAEEEKRFEDNKTKIETELSDHKKKIKKETKAAFNKSQKENAGMTQEQLDRAVISDRSQRIQQEYRSKGFNINRGQASLMAKQQLATEAKNPERAVIYDAVDTILENTEKDPVFGYKVAPQDFADIVSISDEATALESFASRIGKPAANRAMADYKKSAGQSYGDIAEDAYLYAEQTLLNDDASINDFRDYINKAEASVGGFGDASDAMIFKGLAYIGSNAKNPEIRKMANMVSDSYKPDESEMKLFEIGKQGQEQIIGVNPVTKESEILFSGTPGASSGGTEGYTYAAAGGTPTEDLTNTAMDLVQRLSTYKGYAATEKDRNRRLTYHKKMISTGRINDVIEDIKSEAISTLPATAAKTYEANTNIIAAMETAALLMNTTDIKINKITDFYDFLSKEAKFGQDEGRVFLNVILNLGRVLQITS
jgi:hypothetical protein